MTERLMKMLVVGLMDDLKGHYKEFAKRWIEALRKIDDSLEIVGYLTSRNFKFQDFNKILSHDTFFNILFDCRREYSGNLIKLQSLFIGIIRGLQTNIFLRKHKPEAVFYLAVDLLSFPLANFILSPPKKLKMITIIHRAPNVPGIRGRLYKYSLVYVIKKNNAIVVLDPSVKDQIIKMNLNIDLTKIKVIYDPRFRDAKCEITKAIMPRAPKIFTIVGLITPSKGVDLAISAFATLKEEFPDIHLIIAGHINDIAYKDYLYKLRADNQNITIYDRYLEKENYYQHIREADCILLPYKSSLGALCSSVLLDAISFNKPVIISDIPSFKMYHEKFGLGEIFAADNKEDLTSIIKKTILNGFDQRQIKAIAAVKREFSIETASALIKRILREIETTF